MMPTFLAANAISTPTALALMGLVSGLGAFGFLQAARRNRQRRQRIAQTPTSRVASCAPGLAELHGRVTPLQLLKSPLSGTDCVHWSLLIEGQRKDGKETRWVRLHADSRAADFLLDDGTGRIQVKPAGAEWHLDRDNHARSGTFNDPTPELERLFQQVGLKSTTFFGFNRALRVHETVLEADDEVFILGTIQPEAGAVSHSIGKAGDLFLVSDGDERRLDASLGQKAMLGTAIGLVLLLTSGGLFTGFIAMMM